MNIVLSTSNKFWHRQVQQQTTSRQLKSLGSSNYVSRPSYAVSESDIDIEGMDVESLNIDYTKGMPDKNKFKSFFSSTVKRGEEMTLEQFVTYDEVSQLLKDGLIYFEDVNDLWISAVGDAEGLDSDEAYEMLCMVIDLPDPEDIQYLDEAYENLVLSPTNTLSFDKMMTWGDIEDMIKEEALTPEEITDIWTSIAGDKNSSINRIQFGKFNNALDDKIFEKENEQGLYDEDDDGGDEEEETDESDEEEIKTAPISSVQEVADVEDPQQNEKEDVSSLPEIDLTDINIWDPDFDPAQVFEEEVYNDISKFYRKNAKSGGLSFTSFRQWEEVELLVADGALSEQDLKSLWAEAPKNMKGLVDFDTFVRMNIRMDVIMDENEAKKNARSKQPQQSSPSTAAGSTASETTASTTMSEAERFYRTEFKKLTAGGRLLRLDMLLEWPDVAELVEDGTVSTKQITKMFEGMPREPMGIPSTELGISEDTFVAFNGLLDVLIDATSGKADENRPKEKVSAPSMLISDASLPKPQISELKLGSLGSPSSPVINAVDDESNTGLSKEEMEMMEMLDKADNMLNSGSYSDFDQLIGDINDPRLQAIREKDELGRAKLQGELKDIVKDLLSLGRMQSRCGLDAPDEETAARLRDLMTAAIEKGPKLANQPLDKLRENLNGKWKLLFSNSEMFGFYNGITGLVNVFPSGKFQGLEMELKSDGYLNEAKYFEELSTLVGPVKATVYANWELVKEMSFMTNENSVVLRNYCTKVTAGPFEYMAEENWKSLRAMSLNELVYVDDKIRIMRNAGALRIFFLYERL